MGMVVIVVLIAITAAIYNTTKTIMTPTTLLMTTITTTNTITINQVKLYFPLNLVSCGVLDQCLAAGVGALWH